jgi:hypothetical protein
MCDSLNEPVSDIPDQAGVLQFATRDEALAALDELADRAIDWFWNH